MNMRATYVCPVNGLANLGPPDPRALSRASQGAIAFGINCLTIPILEESLAFPVKPRMEFLDGLIQALDTVQENKVKVVLKPLAGFVLDLNWRTKDLVRTPSWAGKKQVFVEGKVRLLSPLEWWVDPPLIQRRIGALRELVSAVAGHPALAGWLLLDRELDWTRPESQAADFVFRSLVAEIRDRDEGGMIGLGLGWEELKDPDLISVLASGADLLVLDGQGGEGAAEEMYRAAFFATLARWIWEKPVEAVMGRALSGQGIGEKDLEAAGVLPGWLGAGEKPGGVSWFNLADPGPEKTQEPPWSIHPDHARCGLLNSAAEPKESLVALMEAFGTAQAARPDLGFLDISPDEYIRLPEMHLQRLWDHFRESV